jgi:hypothetical protein
MNNSQSLKMPCFTYTPQLSRGLIVYDIEVRLELNWNSEIAFEVEALLLEVKILRDA